ncbi:MAG: hypothetical protein DWH91_07075, partial [Planctomycetota bacterium]
SDRYFWLSSELWRASLWGVIGSLLMIPVTYWNMAIVQGRGLGDQIVGCVIFLGLATYLAQFLLARVRVDRQGVHRRIFWFWSCWEWNDFSSGRLRQTVSASCYSDSERPWWCRRLNLGALEESDRLAIDRLILRIWVPHREAISDRIEFRMNWPDRRSLVIDSAGISVRSKHSQMVVPFTKIGQVTLWRLDSARADFRELCMDGPATELVLRQFVYQGRDLCNWTGASAESIAAMLIRLVPLDRLHDYTLTGPARTAGEFAARLSRELPKLRETQRVARWCAVAGWCAVACCFLFNPRDLWMGAVFAIQMLGFQAVSGMMVRDSRRRIADLERQRAEWMSGEN